jgi:phosphatidylserine decarboxylase
MPLKAGSVLARVLLDDRLNYVLTNRVPRRSLTRFMGWFSRVEQPLVRKASIAAFRFFADDLRLHEARQERFRSLHDCFVRELKPGVRPVDPAPDVLVSPCDAVLGACGRAGRGALIQAKGSAYSLEELLQDGELARAHEGACFATLRLKADMYHRFHAPHDCRVTAVTYVPGDVFNVNPPALARIPRLYCRNERAVLHARLDATGEALTLVPVGAILVAGIRLSFLDLDRDAAAPRRVPCDARFAKGEELGYFEHGSTVLVLAPARAALVAGVGEGSLLRMGEPLMRLG